MCMILSRAEKKEEGRERERLGESYSESFRPCPTNCSSNVVLRAAVYQLACILSHWVEGISIKVQLFS